MMILPVYLPESATMEKLCTMYLFGIFKRVPFVHNVPFMVIIWQANWKKSMG